MTKIQKIWLCIFVVMFVIPELLFGPALGGVNFLLHTKFSSLLSSQLTSENIIVAYTVLLLESAGIVGLLVIIQKIKSKEFIKILVNTFIIFVMLALILVWYISLTLDGILK
jgi:hypothetical protein